MDQQLTNRDQHEMWVWKDVPANFVPLNRRPGLYLDIGAGERPHANMLHVDIRRCSHVEVICDIRALPFPDNTFQGVFVDGVVEHFPFAEVQEVISEWVRVTAKWIYITTLDIQRVCEQYLNREMTASEFEITMFGFQNFPENFHMCCFDFNYLRGKMLRAGCKKVRRVKDYHLFGADFYPYPYEVGNNLHVIGIKHMSMRGWDQKKGKWQK